MVEFVNKINKENNSLTTLRINNNEFPLNEKELQQLISSLANMREDLFVQEGYKLDSNAQDKIEDLEDEITRLHSIIDEIKDCADYD